MFRQFMKRLLFSKRQPTMEFLQSASDIVDKSVFTFADVNFGKPAKDRIIIVGVLYGTALNDSVTIGGVVARFPWSAVDPTSHRLGIWVAKVPDGTSGDIVLDMAASTARCHIHVYRATGLREWWKAYDVGSDTDETNPLVLNILCPQNSIMLVMSRNAGGVGNCTWSVTGERIEEESEVDAEVSSSSGSGEWNQARTVMVVSHTWSVGPALSIGVSWI